MSLDRIDIPALRRTIRATFELRQRRKHALFHNILGEPAWDILLILALESPSDLGHTIDSISRTASASKLLLERWIMIFLEHGLVHETETILNERVYYLTDNEWIALWRIFSDIIE